MSRADQAAETVPTYPNQNDGIVLIVDDDPIGRTTMEASLSGDGYHLELASNGSEALELAARLLPDLVLLDVMMPDMNGFEVCRFLRTDPYMAEMPVIMVTALDDTDSRLRGLEAGADDFITRPYRRVELRARVRTVMRLNRYRRLLNERTQRQQAEATTRRQIRRLSALHAINLEATSSLDSEELPNLLAHLLHKYLNVDGVAVAMYDAADNTLTYRACLNCHQGFENQSVLLKPMMLTHRTVHKAAMVYVVDSDVARDAVALPMSIDAPHTTMPIPLSRRALLTPSGFVSYYVLPLIARGQVRGVLELFFRSSVDPERDWLDFLETLAGQLATTLDNADLFAHVRHAKEELAAAYDATLEGWVRTLDMRDQETEDHTQRVTMETLRLARAMGISENEMAHIRRGALLHDIGKMAVPDRILHKPGKLDEDEWAIMRQHPVYAYDLLMPISYLRPALVIPYCHHEKWDGTGYPRGLCGTDIPLVARIFAVIDVWDALLSDRPYRKRWSEERVLDYLREQAGTHFDPQVVEAFLALRGAVASTTKQT